KQASENDIRKRLEEVFDRLAMLEMWQKHLGVAAKRAERERSFAEELERQAFTAMWKTFLGRMAVREVEDTVRQIKNRDIQLHVLDEIERAVKELRKSIRQEGK